MATDRRQRFDQPAGDVWSALTQVQEYQRWWPWLRRFDATAFRSGERWTCEVQPPVPYRLRFVLHLDHVVAGRSATASVTGDIVGTARIELEPTAGGSELHLASTLEPAAPVLRMALRLVPPLARFGHDWIIDTGLRQFTACAFAAPGET